MMRAIMRRPRLVGAAMGLTFIIIVLRLVVTSSPATKPPAASSSGQPNTPQVKSPPLIPSDDHLKLSEGLTFTPVDPLSVHTHYLPWQNENGKFTVYMITYDRDELCKRLVTHYAKSEYVDKIVLSWNNVGRKPPPVSDFGITKELIIVEETSDTLNNRFRPHPFITTDCVFTVDDDILVPLNVLEFAFSVFKQFPTTIIGFSQYVRPHGHKPTFVHCTEEEDPQKWYYSAECTGPNGDRVYNGPKPFPVASIALDSAMMFHKRYLRMYTEDLPKSIHKYVDEVRNCEDLAMPMLVAHVTRLPPVIVDAPGMEHLQHENKKGHHPGLNTLTGHYQTRIKCMNVLADIFGYMPLQFTNFKLQPFPAREVL